MSPDLITPQSKPSKLPAIAAIVAFLLVAFSLTRAFGSPVEAIAGSVIPLMAGIGILRKRVWPAYGFALMLITQSLLVPLLTSRDQAGWLELLLAAILMMALAGFYFWAGRALKRTGEAKAGWAFPWIALFVLSTTPFLFVRAFVMPSGSMEDTILIGDRFFVRIFPRVNVQRGDIVAFHFPIDRKQTLLKRVIGVPGDRIRVVSNVAYVNGSVVQEPYVVHKLAEPDEYRDNIPPKLVLGEPVPYRQGELELREMLTEHVVNGEVVVPAGKYFVLGDNRDHSLDSRFWAFLDGGDVVGKPLFIYYSDERSDDVVDEAWPKIRWNRFLRWL